MQTLYLAWGSKRALLHGHLEAALAGAPDVAFEEQVPRLSDGIAEHGGASPRVVIEHIARLYCGIAERAALGWRLYRDAAATDAEIAADWSSLHGLRHGTFTRLLAHIPDSALRAGLTRSQAIDTAWTIASPETHALLVDSGRYTLDQYQDWVTATLLAALLDPVLLGPRSADGHVLTSG